MLTERKYPKPLEIVIFNSQSAWKCRKEGQNEANQLEEQDKTDWINNITKIIEAVKKWQTNRDSS